MTARGISGGAIPYPIPSDRSWYLPGGESVRVTLTSGKILEYTRNGEKSTIAVTTPPTTPVTEVTVIPTVTPAPVKTEESTLGLIEFRELYLILLLVIIAGWCIYFNQKSRSYIELGSHAVPINPATGTIFAESLPEGAAIQINSRFVGYAPTTIPTLLPRIVYSFGTYGGVYYRCEEAQPCPGPGIPLPAGSHPETVLDKPVDSRDRPIIPLAGYAHSGACDLPLCARAPLYRRYYLH